MNLSSLKILTLQPRVFFSVFFLIFSQLCAHRFETKNTSKKCGVFLCCCFYFSTKYVHLLVFYGQHLDQYLTNKVCVQFSKHRILHFSAQEGGRGERDQREGSPTGIAPLRKGLRENTGEGVQPCFAGLHCMSRHQRKS